MDEGRETVQHAHRAKEEKKQDAHLAWEVRKRHEACRLRVFHVQELESVSPRKTVRRFVTLTAPEWVIVVPHVMERAQRFFVMVRQWRCGSQTVCTEFPGGVIDAGEHPEAAARRELFEETGRRASSLAHLGTIHPNPAVLENRVHIFSAECTPEVREPQLDTDEFLERCVLPVHDVYERMGRAPFDHALMGAALFLFLRAHPLSSL